MDTYNYQHHVYLVTLVFVRFIRYNANQCNTDDISF